MRLVLIFLVTAEIASAQTIATKILTPGAPIKISLSTALTTTLLFPGPLGGAFGLGLVLQTSAQPASSGSVQIEHPDGSPIVVLHALNESAAVIMTILLDGKLYVFDLKSAPNPDVAVTLVKDTTAPRVTEVTPEEIKATRLKFDPELFKNPIARLLFHARAYLRDLDIQFSQAAQSNSPQKGARRRKETRFSYGFSGQSLHQAPFQPVKNPRRNSEHIPAETQKKRGRTLELGS